MTTQMREHSDFWSVPPFVILCGRTLVVTTEHPEDGPGIAQNGQHHNQIDFILVWKRFRSGVNSARTRSFLEADIRSDFDLLMMTFHLRVKRISKPKYTLVIMIIIINHHHHHHHHHHNDNNSSSVAQYLVKITRSRSFISDIIKFNTWILGYYTLVGVLSLVTHIQHIRYNQIQYMDTWLVHVSWCFEPSHTHTTYQI